MTTREAILTTAERLFAEHGVYAVSNRQVSEAAGQGNNAAVGYHVGTKTDLVRAIEQKHRAPIERLLDRMLAEIDDSAELRDWVACLVCSLTEHLDELGIMARNLLMHTCADFERAFAAGAAVPHPEWSGVASGLIDAIVGLWLAPVTCQPDTVRPVRLADAKV